VFTAPILWVGLECLRGIVIFDGYPWYLAGTALLGLPIVAIATIGSVWLASYFVVTVAAALATAKEVRMWTWGILAVIIVFFFVDGARMQTNRGPRIDVAVIQTNVTQSNKEAWSWERQLEDVNQAIDLTYEAVHIAEIQPSLIIWPETMLPGSGFEIDRFDFAPWDERFTHLWYWSEKIRMVSKELDTPILVGSQTWIDVTVIEDTEYLRVDPSYQFNSAVLIQPDGTTQRYDKIFLTPFGERIPYLENFPDLKGWVRKKVGAAMLFDLSAGGDPTRFSMPCTQIATPQETEITFATPICFEDTVPSVVRELIWENGVRKADALINLSNDGWFGSDDGARLQHVREARMRCVENMTPMVRAANTGLSCNISQYGNVIKSSVTIRESGILPTRVFAGMGLPLSRFVGDWIAWLCLFGSILLIVVSCVYCDSCNKRSKGQEDETSS
jgi:apolipoprotein N-acyltransferase